jgi:tRNA pseudouridine38-40 synthase
MKYLARIAYVGTLFSGYQVQPDKRTVQGVLSEACRSFFGTACTVSGCSRTDAGVHAKDFCVLLEPDAASRNLPPPERLPMALRPHLPSDLSILSAEKAPEGLHVRHDVKEKEYRYFIHLSRTPDPFLAGRAWFYPAPLGEDAVSRMQHAADHLVGEHDFSAFMAQGSAITDATRTIFGLRVWIDGDILTVSVTGNGFLYNMVRIITGTLVDVAEGRIEPDSVADILRGKERKYAGQTAPPDGLYLWKVTY